MSDAGSGDPISDDLVRRLSSGDDSALEPLMKHHNRWLRPMVAGFIWNPPDRDDIIQIVWLKIIENRAALRPVGFKSFLRKIASNECIDHIRRQNVVRKHEIAEPPGEDDQRAAIENVEGGLSGDFSGLDEDISDCLRQLPYKLQEGVVLYYLGGYKLDEIAERTRISRTSVHNRLQEGLAKLHSCLDEKPGKKSA